MIFRPDIVIFDHLESKNIAEFIVKPISDKFTFLNIKFFSKYFGENNFSRLLFLIYSVIYLFFFRPKCVITFRDNGDIQHIHKIFRSINFFAIQNGNRTKRELISKYGYGQKRKLNLPNYFSFGLYEKETFKYFGHIIQECIPVGSFRASIYQAKFNQMKSKKYDICFISMWRDVNFNSYDDNVLLKETEQMKMVDDLILEFVERHKLKLAICLRSGHKGLEYNYYKSLYSKSAKLVFRDEFSTYKTMDISELIISSHSTCSSEALGWKKKSIYVDFSKNNIFAYFDKSIVIRKPEFKSFDSKVKALLDMNQKTYQKKLKNYSSYVMNYDSKKPTFEKIQDELKKYLS